MFIVVFSCGFTRDPPTTGVFERRKAIKETPLRKHRAWLVVSAEISAVSSFDVHGPLKLISCFGLEREVPRIETRTGLVSKEKDSQNPRGLYLAEMVRPCEPNHSIAIEILQIPVIPPDTRNEKLQNNRHVVLKS